MPISFLFISNIKHIVYSLQCMAMAFENDDFYDCLLYQGINFYTEMAELEEELGENVPLPRRFMRDRENPLELYEEEDFRRHYGFGKDNFLYLFNLIRDP